MSVAAPQRAVALLWLILSVLAGAAGQAAGLEDLASFPHATLKITSGSKSHVLNVWVADTPPRQAQGLMFVRDLPADQGMLFVHREPRMASMWMKNTYIELDMLFIAPDGRIVHIVERTRPHSLETISSGVPVGAVLEIRGGEAARHAVRVGDRVSWEPDP